MGNVIKPGIIIQPPIYVKSWLILTICLVAALKFRYCVAQKNLYLYPQTKNRVVEHYFEITDGIVQPDNYKQMGYLINGQFPGPPIFCNQFDLVKVTVVNRMIRPCAIHFHGILQSHTVASDGVPGVTQKAIGTNETYVYEIQIGTQTGTYAYHGHFQFDIVFIHGAFIIRDNPSYWRKLGADYQYSVGFEHYFILEQIYHYSLDQYFLDIMGQWEGPPIASLPINGLSYGKWADNNGNAPGYEVVTVTPGQTYRFRIINMAPDALLRFKIEGHKLRVIEMDGILCFPVWADYLEINTGQRYSVLVKMDKTINNYWIHSENIDPDGGPDNGRAILHYSGAPDPKDMRKQVFNGTTPAIPFSNWELAKLYPNARLSQTEVYGLPKRSDKTIVIDTHLVIDSNGTYKFLINNHYYQQPSIPYLTQVQEGIDIGKTDSKQVYSVIEDQVVDIIFQNRVMDDGPCLQHPWHLHGHSFWVLAQGPDTYSRNKVQQQIEINVQTERHQFRDVFTMFPDQTKENTTSGAGCGWAVIRFLANNPGIWLAHCHITAHMLVGKQFVIYEYEPDNPTLMNE